MGHRASVAYVTEDEVKAHYSHWGAIDVRLLDAISEDDPYASGQVNADTDVTADSLAEWARECVDYLHHEAAYIVDTRGDEWTVTAYATVRWLGFDPEQPEDAVAHHSRGALVRVDSAEEYDQVHGIEYDWEAGDNDGSNETVQEQVDQVMRLEDGEIHMTEDEFAKKLAAEYGDRIPEFSQYAESDSSHG